MSAATPQLFSALQIARALNRSKRGVLKALCGIQPQGRTYPNGQEADAWQLDQLPQGMRAKLEETQRAGGFRDVPHLLNNAPERWQPTHKGQPVSLAQISADCIAAAFKLQRALQSLMPQLAQCRSISELEAVGLREHHLAFGYTITARHWRSLVERTLARDGGEGQWERLELYLPERLTLKAPAATRRQTSPFLARLDMLEAALSQVKNPSQPTLRELEFVWLKACDELREQIAAGTDERSAKQAILVRLESFGHLAEGASALRRNFNRKWSKYCAEDGGVAAIRDRRTLRYAGSGPALGKEDRERLIARSLDCGGRVAQAWRELTSEGALSAPVLQRFIANPKKKSYIPEIVRRDIVPEVERLLPVHRGPREHELRGACFRRDYSNLFAGDSYQADDVTCPVYWFEADADSPHGYRVMRGQLILMIDERSLLALGFALNSEPTYNSRIIRSLVTRVHDDFGLPRRRFKFERGIWRAKILRGDEVDSEHTERGLREFGIHFSYTNYPRGKQVERVIGLFQNEMERLPGYCGRDEMHERFERLQKKLRMAQSGTLHPSQFLMSKAQWMEKISEILERYNQAPQQGQILKGLSPLQAWNRMQAPEGRVKLGPQVRYLLAHHKLPMMVQRNGLTLRSSLGGGVYCNEITGRFVRQRVWVWCDPDNLDYIAITSLDGKQGPFVVPRLDDIPAIDATREQLAAGRAQISAHNGYAKTLYRTISTKLAVHNFRRLQADAASVESGEKLRAGIEAANVQKRRSTESIRKLRDAARELNVPSLRVTSGTAERTARGFDLIANAKRKHAQQSGETTT